MFESSAAGDVALGVLSWSIVNIQDHRMYTRGTSYSPWLQHDTSKSCQTPDAPSRQSLTTELTRANANANVYVCDDTCGI